MSSEILPSGDHPIAAAPFWRTVSPAVEQNAKSHGKNDAQRDLAQQIDQARREAFAQGLAAGREELERQVRPAVDGLAKTLTELSRMRDVIRQESTIELVKLAVSIAARIIHRDVIVDPDALAGLVTAAFRKVQSREIHKVRMHPATEAMVNKCLEQSGAPKNLVLQPDPSLHPGEIFFETSQGVLDASVETQLREIERGLIDKLER